MAELTILSNTGVRTYPLLIEAPDTATAVVHDPGCWARVIARCWASGTWPPLVWNHDPERRLGRVTRLLELLPSDPRVPDEVRALGRGVGCLVGHVRFAAQKYREARWLVDYIAGGGAKLRFSPRTTAAKWYEDDAGVVHFQEVAEVHEISACWQAANPATAVLAVA